MKYLKYINSINLADVIPPMVCPKIGVLPYMVMFSVGVLPYMVMLFIGVLPLYVNSKGIAMGRYVHIW